MIRLLCSSFCLLLSVYACNNNQVIQGEPLKDVAIQVVEDSVMRLSPPELPTQNKDTTNDIWNGNVYRNILFRFRIELPKGWDYDKGSSISTVVRAADRKIGATISVVIRNLGPALKHSDDITKNITANELKEEMIKRLNQQKSNATNFTVKKGYLNNFPAYLIEFNQIAKSADREFSYLSKQVQCHMGNYAYVVGLNIPEEHYDDEMNKLYYRGN